MILTYEWILSLLISHFVTYFKYGTVRDCESHIWHYHSRRGNNIIWNGISIIIMNIPLSLNREN